MPELEPLVKELKGRSYNNGKEAFTAAQCAACHVFGKEGGASGPDRPVFSPDGKTLASASEDTSVKLWDTSTYQELATFRRLLPASGVMKMFANRM